MKAKFLRDEKGSALIISFALVVVVLGLVMAMSTAAISESRAVDVRADALRALQIAEAGLGLARVELVSGTDAGGDGLGTVRGSLDHGAFSVRATTTTTDRGTTVILTSTGAYNDVSRTIEVVMVKPALLLTAADFGAVSIMIDPGVSVSSSTGGVPIGFSGANALVSGEDHNAFGKALSESEAQAAPALLLNKHPSNVDWLVDSGTGGS